MLLLSSNMEPINLSCVAIVLLALLQMSTQNCITNNVQIEAPPSTDTIPYVPQCKEGVEMYIERDPETGLHTQVCCPSAEDSQYQYYKGVSIACKNTTCVSKATASSSKDLCADHRPTMMYINREPQKYVETVRDECVDENGNLGTAALCCPPDTMDVMLTTLVGAEPEEFPYFARVGNYGCGGTVYNEQWIITAAHCVVNEEKKRILDLEKDGAHAYYNGVGTVRINILMRDIPSERIYTTEEVHVFPNSSWTQPDAPEGTSWGDVALLKMKTKIQFGEKIKALRIVEPGFDALKYGTHGFVTGFGQTDTLRQPLKMQKANMVLHPKDQINFMLQEHDQLMFGGGILKDIISPNFGTGDSGGPFACRDEKGMIALCGVVSFLAGSSENCLKNLTPDTCRPSSFNDVGYFHDWIVKTAGTQENAELWEQSLYGADVGKSDYPAHVHITSSEGDSCGGTLVADDLVLTAASCVVKKDGNYKSGLMVAVGVMDAKKGGGKSIGVKTVAAMGPLTEVPRPAWGGGSRRKRMTQLPYEAWKAGKWGNKKIQKDPYYKDNVALVKLASKSGKTPAKLGSQKLQTGDMAMEVSYRTESLGTAAKGSLPLTKRRFKVIDRKECQTRMNRLSQIPYDVKIDSNVVCGVETPSGGSLCDRELGGGLYCKGANGQEELCGVQVFRLCDFSIPNEFIDVSKIKNWLDSAMKQLK